MLHARQAKLCAAVHVDRHRRPGRQGTVERDVLEDAHRLCSLGQGKLFSRQCDQMFEYTVA